MRALYYLIFTLLPLSTAFGLDEHIIESKQLGYKLKYWVQVPEGNNQALPVLFVTDGAWYKEGGQILKISKTVIDQKKANPHILVLVDAFDPDRPDYNRRNQQFFCNEKYVNFFKKELIPAVERKYNVLKTRDSRGIVGMSFGGLNSMYFALEANDVISKFGILSPAPHPCPDIYSRFEQSKKLPIDIFLSTGTVNDKERATRKLKGILDKKGYEINYVEVAQGHNWNNWRPLLDDLLIYFFPATKS